jgi:hypothetical protein
MFDFPLLQGSYASLKDPNNVLLTKEIAETYFGDWKTAMGKTIKLTGYYNMGAALFQFPPVALKVSGILATIPQIPTFQLKLVVAGEQILPEINNTGFNNPAGMEHQLISVVMFCCRPIFLLTILISS